MAALNKEGRRWFPPLRLLVLLCTLTVLIYFDRGAIASNGVNGARTTDKVPGYGIQGEFNIGMIEDGLLATSVVLGIMFSAPVSAQLAKSCNHLRMIGVGLVLWASGAVGCSLAPSFHVLLAARVCMGLGTGPFIAVSAPLVDDAAPRSRKSLWLACLFLCITVGYASGFAVGGLAGAWYGWRAVLAGEGTLMVPFALAVLLAPEARPPAGDEGMMMHGSRDKAAAIDAAEPSEEESILAQVLLAELAAAEPALTEALLSEIGDLNPRARTLWQEVRADLRGLFVTAVPCCTILALTMYVGSISSLSFYGPKAAKDVLLLDRSLADVAFGLTSLFAGSVGTLVGGAALDVVGANLKYALLICACAVLVGSTMLVIAFMQATTLHTFFLLLALGQMLIFMIGAPSMGVLLWSSPAKRRPFVLAVSELTQHVLGDVPMPLVYGWLQGTTENWRLTMGLAAAVIGASAVLYLLAICLGPRASIEHMRLELLETLTTVESGLLSREPSGVGLGGMRRPASGIDIARGGCNGASTPPLSSSFTPESLRRLLLVAGTTPQSTMRLGGDSMCGFSGSGVG